ncbi:monocarboxylate transporter 12-B-like isoform X3 [Rhipicephalus microplus]|uniref:monocarboxylate transporter 12-B-like isoform X3 n=1 Tax=Rhipicephalus microplus TaxID=6941 RepID=UPI003F6CAA33
MGVSSNVLRKVFEVFVHRHGRVPPAATTMPGRRTWYAWNCCPRLQKQGPDSVHSWLVAVACAMSSFFALAGWRSLGFLFVAIQETFQVNRTEGSWPIVVLGALGYMTGFITGPLAQRFGGRPVISLGAAISSIGLMSSFFATTIGFLTFSLGVLHAIGTGMVFIVAPTIVSEHFVKNLGLAMGLNYAGVTAALFVFPKLLEYLVAGYGLRGALLICGAITMNGLAFSIFTGRPTWRVVAAGEDPVSTKLPPKAPEVERSHEIWHALTVFRSPMFYLIMYSFNAYCMSYDLYMSLFVDFASDRGVTVATALSVMAAGAVTEGVGRFTLPMAVDRSLITNNVALMLTLGAEAVAFLMLPFLHNHGLIFAVAILIGFIIGTAIVLFPVTLDYYFGHEKMSIAFGIVVASAGLQSFVRPSLIGHFRDRGGAYDWLFIICGVANVVAAALWMVALAWENSRRKNIALVEITPACAIISKTFTN